MGFFTLPDLYAVTVARILVKDSRALRTITRGNLNVLIFLRIRGAGILKFVSQIRAPRSGVLFRDEFQH